MSDLTKREVAAAEGEPDDPLRINKREFIRKMAAEADLPANVAAVAYEAFVKTLLDQVRAGVRVNLTGFGRFYWQEHKGHHVQFGKGPKKKIDDYTVLKFSATREANDFVGRDDEDVLDLRVPGTRLKAMATPSEEGAATEAPDVD